MLKISNYILVKEFPLNGVHLLTLGGIVLEYLNRYLVEHFLSLLPNNVSITIIRERA